MIARMHRNAARVESARPYFYRVRSVQCLKMQRQFLHHQKRAHKNHRPGIARGHPSMPFYDFVLLH